MLSALILQPLGIFNFGTLSGRFWIKVHTDLVIVANSEGFKELAWIS